MHGLCWSPVSNNSTALCWRGTVITVALTNKCPQTEYTPHTLFQALMKMVLHLDLPVVADLETMFQLAVADLGPLWNPTEMSVHCECLDLLARVCSDCTLRPARMLCTWVGGWGSRYPACKRERGSARVPRLLGEDFIAFGPLIPQPGTMKEHGYVTLPSRSVGAVLGDLDVSTDAAWSTGHSAIHSLVTWSEESFSSMIDSVDGQVR